MHPTASRFTEERGAQTVQGRPVGTAGTPIWPDGRPGPQPLCHAVTALLPAISRSTRAPPSQAPLDPDPSHIQALRLVPRDSGPPAPAPRPWALPVLVLPERRPTASRAHTPQAVGSDYPRHAPDLSRNAPVLSPSEAADGKPNTKFKKQIQATVFRTPQTS